MAHIRKDAVDGFMYQYKYAENEFASTVYIGEGRSEDDYKLITLEEYQRMLDEQEMIDMI